MMERLEASVGELEASERRFRLLTETAHDAIICCLANGQIILFNHQAERLFGYRAAETIGMRGEELIHPDCRELADKSLEELLSSDPERFLSATVFFVGRHRDGRALPLALSLSAADSDGHRFFTAIVRERGEGRG
jgi:PAS domain S-box-containing protein